MDGNVGSFNIIPDQMGIINSLLILALVPLFESCIYPAFTKCGLLTPLQRMGCGGLLAALAFVISGILELQLEVLIYYCNISIDSFHRLDRPINSQRTRAFRARD